MTSGQTTDKSGMRGQRSEERPASVPSQPPIFAERLYKFLSSLRLTVVFLALAVLLVFIGTIAQVDEGLYSAQNRFFRSFIVWWGPKGAGWKLPVYPGGYLIGGVLLINIVLSYSRRIELSRKKIGLLLIHVGLILLLLGQFATDLLSNESAMQLFEGESKNYSEDFRANELVLIDKSAPDKERVYSVPGSQVKPGAEIRDSQLPFTFQVKKHWANAVLVERSTNTPPMAIPSGATSGLMKEVMVIPAPVAANADARNMPAVVVEVLAGGKSLGSYLVSSMLNRPDQFMADGKEYEIGMRLTRYYYPFSLTLLKATHEKYKGTEIPKNFSSRVRVENASKNEARETAIFMNNPLRYSGLTFFQFQMGADEMAMREGQRASSTFQVVRNPSWLTPYLSCVLISLGLLFQFATHLFGFVRRRKA